MPTRSGKDRGNKMAYIHYHRQPELRHPALIAALAGWNDAADAATTAVKFLIDRWKPAKLAEIEPEEFYVFTETRPTIQANRGLQSNIIWPTNQFLSYSAPYLDNDIMLYLGVEPQLKWKTFTDTFLEVCKRFNISEVLLLGAFLVDIPHSMAVPVSGFSSSADTLERLRGLDARGSNYTGPTGMVGVLPDSFRRANIPVSSQ